MMTIAIARENGEQNTCSNSKTETGTKLLKDTVWFNESILLIHCKVPANQLNIHSDNCISLKQIHTILIIEVIMLLILLLIC